MTLTDPSSLTFEVQPPGGTATSYAYSRISVGKYRGLVDCTTAGTWKYRWSSPGPVAKGASGWLEFNVAP